MLTDGPNKTGKKIEGKSNRTLKRSHYKKMKEAPSTIPSQQEDFSMLSLTEQYLRLQNSDAQEDVWRLENHSGSFLVRFGNYTREPGEEELLFERRVQTKRKGDKP